MELIETELRNEREENIIAEEEETSRRLEKMSRLKRAWQLKMEAGKYQRMIAIMEQMSVGDMEMEVDWIKSKIIEMMEMEYQVDVETKKWLVDRDGDQVMPQVEVRKAIEEEYMEGSVCMPSVGPEVHTPLLNAKLL